MNLEEIKDTLNYLLDNNLKLVEKGFNKIAINLIGAAGCGKTSIVQQIAEERGAGYKRLNLSELEEVGDLVGSPIREYIMHKNGEERWVSEKIVDRYLSMGWELCEYCEPRMSYATPSWVPKDPDQEFILNLDDYTRATSLFMQAIMSLIQFGEYISWKLPKKCFLILTSNPDDGNYNVSELDAAQNSRMINFNVDFDIDVFGKWMNKVGIRSECQNFALLSPEIFNRNAIINARSYTMFANAISGFENYDDIATLEKISAIAKGCFNDEYVSDLFIQFVHNKLDKLISPEEMIKGTWETVQKKLTDNIYRDDKYDAAVASVLTMRLVNYIDTYFTKSLEKNKSEKVIDRLVEICTKSDKMLLSEDLIYKLIKTLNAKYPTRCSKIMQYPEIRNKML